MEVSEYYQKMKVLAAELRYCWHCSALCYRGCRCYTCGADNWGSFVAWSWYVLSYLSLLISVAIHLHWIEVLSVRGGRTLKDNSGVIRLITICKILLHHWVRIPDYRSQWTSCLKLQICHRDKCPCSDPLIADREVTLQRHRRSGVTTRDPVKQDGSPSKSVPGSLNTVESVVHNERRKAMIAPKSFLIMLIINRFIDLELRLVHKLANLSAELGNFTMQMPFKGDHFFVSVVFYFPRSIVPSEYAYDLNSMRDRACRQTEGCGEPG